MATLGTRTISWEMVEPFTISRGTQTHAEGILLTLSDGEHTGRGEAYGISYEGESPEAMLAQIESVRETIEAGVTREELFDLLPNGGARCAVDFALWDLSAKRSGTPAWRLAGVQSWNALDTAFTIGMRPRSAVSALAARCKDYRTLKIKVGAHDPLDVLRAVRETAPGPKLIVDPNQSWSIDQLKEMAPQCKELGVVLLEQPLAAGQDQGLEGYRCPVAIAADESIRDINDLHAAAGKYDVINIKLDKAGGLTAGLRLAQAALAQGYRLMIGCMEGSSLSMAPGFIVGQLCDYVDLDGPLLQKEDWPHGIRYENGKMTPPSPLLWG